MKRKVLKVATVISLVAIVFISVFGVYSFASNPELNTLFANPYCPTLYGHYRVANGDTYSRKTGGYASNTRFMENSRATMYMTCKYINASYTNTYSILGDDLYVENPTLFDSEYRYYDTDCIYYGLSTVRGSDSYVYFPMYSLYDCFFGYYLSEGESGNTNDSYLLYDDIATSYDFSCHIVIAYLTGSGELKSVQVRLTPLSSPSGYGGFGYGGFGSLRNFLQYRVHAEDFDDKAMLYSIGCTVSGEVGYFEDVNRYCNFLFAIPNAEEYIENNQYVEGLQTVGITKVIKEQGVFGIISNSISGFLSFEIYEGFTFGWLLAICVAVPTFVWILKLLAGG